MNAAQTITLEPQQGPQRAFIHSKADIAIYGGAAGGGKTFGLLIDPLRHYANRAFGGTIFRRTSVQVRVEGGLWDQSERIYPLLRGRSRAQALEWRFPTGMAMSFANLEHESDVHNYQGSEMPWIGFDELTHFSEKQFFYMLTRNRSTSGVKPRVRATCNPDPDSWVRKFIDWWIGKDGFPITERAAKLRWFIRQNDEIVWANTKEELILQYGTEMQPKSVTFIPAKLSDNQILMKADPAYKGNLMAQGYVDRMRLLDGNWDVRASAGNVFRREWFPIVDSIPANYLSAVRFWDRAATKPNPENTNPDWTRGLKLFKLPGGKWLVADLKSAQDTPGQIEKLIKTTATHDGFSTKVRAQRDPGSAGVSEAEHFIKMLAGFDVDTAPFSSDKLTRAKPASAQAEWSNILVLRAPWNEDFFKELESFPSEGAHDDIVDALSGAFNELSGGLSILDAI